MADNHVVIIPGLLGSRLFFAGGGDYYWTNYDYIIRGSLNHLRLADDGYSPHPDGGSDLVPDVPLSDYYGQLKEHIDQRIRFPNVVTHQMGWDWRKDLRWNANILYDQSMSLLGAGDTLTYVAHSAGGLIARMIWRRAKDEGKENVIRRIITLGSPHYGSHLAVQVFYHIHPLLRTLSRATRYASYAPPYFLDPFNRKSWTNAELADLIGTFPSIYQMFPFLDGPRSGDDPLRPQLFEEANWQPGRGVKDKWLKHARDNVQPYLMHPDSFPPSHVMTTIAGRGFSTPFGVKYGRPIGEVISEGDPVSGDGTVTIDSALLPGSKQITRASAHDTFPDTMARDDLILNEIAEERSPAQPPPAPVAAPGRAVVPTVSFPIPLNPRTRIGCGGG